MLEEILTELPLYKSGSGRFVDDFAKESRKTVAPGEMPNNSNYSKLT